MIDTVVFDLGNVLVRWDPRGAFAGLDPAEVDTFFAEFDFAAFNHRQDAGLQPFAQARAAAGPRWAPFLDTYLERYADTLGGPVDGSEDLVHELRTHGLRLFGLTNWWAETYHHAEPAAPVIALLDGVVVSGRIGLAKPDPAIFRHLADTYAVSPRRAVFVDDSPPNVAAAAALGFHAVHFTTTDALRTALRDLGLGVRPPGPRPGTAAHPAGT
ncbi:HAD family phosphatase [Xylanimonas allomyrinae]|uniref:HAD family phosphatase n=1 Tax=Xylanimonas allomyrinae TaxID=2509459 RepID=A0A4P6EXF0_9MICO|nr:HAD family phosphatase [Xylanimonas allomyrinae]QAY62698.1 HAD family phosphatase [Xylanimonas allomyrinae]